MDLSPLHIGQHQLPGIWRYLLPEDFQYMRLPDERLANCQKCPEIRCRNFRPDYRCCTYLPKIPAFQLAFAAQQAAFKPLVETLLASRLILPEGMVARPETWFRTIQQNAEDGFGRGNRITCPILDPKSGGCRLHAFRHATCSSFFCYHDHGEAGFHLWDALHNLVLQIESAISQWAMQQLGFDLDRYFEQLDDYQPTSPDDLDGVPLGWPDHLYHDLWQDYADRSSAYFSDLAELLHRHRGELYEIACKQPLRRPQIMESKMMQALTPELAGSLHRDERLGQGDAVRIQTLWYEFQAHHKNLWDLPIGGKMLKQNPHLVDIALSAASLAPGVRDVLEKQVDYVITNPNLKQAKLANIVPLTEVEREIWQLFKTPQQLNEELLSSLPFQRMGHATGRLAEWLRRQVLVFA